jgi:SAM-dependent methyltransferase
MATEPIQPPPTAYKVDVPPALAAGPLTHADSLAAHFDEVYCSANGEASRVPWADCRPCPLLIDWLNTEAPVLVRPGSRAAVVGCGLGDDVVELADRGYDVLGFDISPTAIRWAARRHPDHADRFMVADLLAMPARLLRRFDLVIEAYTLQSLHVSLRSTAAAALAGLVAPRGVVLAVARGRADEQPLAECHGPPHPFTPGELTETLAAAGLYPMHGPQSIAETWDQESPPKRRLHGVFIRT